MKSNSMALKQENVQNNVKYKLTKPITYILKTFCLWAHTDTMLRWAYMKVDQSKPVIIQKFSVHRPI